MENQEQESELRTPKDGTMGSDRHLSEDYSGLRDVAGNLQEAIRALEEQEALIFRALTESESFIIHQEEQLVGTATIEERRSLLETIRAERENIKAYLESLDDLKRCKQTTLETSQATLEVDKRLSDILKRPIRGKIN